MKLPIDNIKNSKVADKVRHLASHMTGREKAALSAFGLIFVISAILTITSFITRNTILLPQEGGSYHEAAVGQPRYLTPILSSANDLDLDITRLVYSSLFTLDSELQLQNDLATGYETSEDQTTYTISLRDDVTWHDGDPFTADDVVFTIRSIQTPDYASPLASSFQGVEVTKIDDYTVQFTLQQPYALFLNSLTVGIAPQHVWEDIPPKNATLAEQILRPIGTGPFKFSEISTRRKTGDITTLELVRNETYYGDRPYLNQVQFSFYPTHEEAIQALRSSRVDGVSFLPLQFFDDIERRGSFTTHSLTIPQYFALFFNQNNNEILNDAGVRAALALSVDRDMIVEEALEGQGDSIHLPIPPGVFAYHEEFGAPTYDPETARQNLEDGGWKDEDGDGIREKDGTRLHVTITTTDWPEYVRTAELVQKQWLEIGVESEIQSYGAGTIQQTIVRPRDYEILLFGEILPAEPDPYPFWHSTQTRSPGLNLALFKDEGVDALLEEARRTSDRDERREKYIEFQEVILDLNPAVILYRPYYLFAQKDKVRGVNSGHTDLPAGRFNNIEEWHVNTKRVWQSSQQN